MAGATITTIVPTGTTGNVTGQRFGNRSSGPVCFQFVVEAIGSTPTCDFTIQGSNDNGSTATSWVAIPYFTDVSDTLATAAITKTTVSTSRIYLDNANKSRDFIYFRGVTANNTNVTFRIEMYGFADEYSE